MKITDRVYGPSVIAEPILTDLIGSAPVQRLKHINQAGASQYVIAGKTVTRYEHSLGVLCLLRMLGASLEEQIAGLLHDVPHTAFSHVIDFVFTSDNHEYHEKFHSDIIRQSEIPEILTSYGFDVEFILDEKNFPLLERELPDLCADRIDYTMRDMTASCGYSNKIAEYIDNLTILNNEIVFKHPDIALRFAEDYLFMDRTRWSHPLEIALYQLLAEALKIALNRNIITQDDLFQDDYHVYNKLREAMNPEIDKNLSMLNPSLTVTDDENDYHFFARNKVRYINPKSLDENQSIRRVTDVYPDYEIKLHQHINRVKRGNFIKIISH